MFAINPERQYLGNIYNLTDDIYICSVSKVGCTSLAYIYISKYLKLPVPETLNLKNAIDFWKTEIPRINIKNTEKKNSCTDKRS